MGCGASTTAYGEAKAEPTWRRESAIRGGPTPFVLYERKVHPKTEKEGAALKAALRKHPLFEYQDETDVDDLVETMKGVQTKAGELVVTAGEIGEQFYVVISGELYALAKGTGQVVRTYGPGTSFGELALLYKSPRACSIKCKGACKLFSLDREEYQNLLMDTATNEDAARALWRKQFKKSYPKNDADRYCLREALRAHPLFEYLPEDVLDDVLDAMEGYVAAEGTLVIKQGDVGEHLYVATSGDLLTTNETTGAAIEGVSVGACFGELALLFDSHRTCSVRCESECQLYRLDRVAFKMLVMELPFEGGPDTTKWKLSFEDVLGVYGPRVRRPSVLP